MKQLIEILEAGRELDSHQVETLIGVLTREGDEESKIQLLKLHAKKGATPAEIAAFVSALRARCTSLPDVDEALQSRLVDLCGTGGDRLHLFNLSTAAAIVVAAAGGAVVKHGNRGISSKSGTADVLEELGIPVEPDPGLVRQSLEQHSFAFLFAPYFHPAFKHIAPARKQLAGEGILTIFNILGPLLNPANPRRQLIGVFDRERAEMVAHAVSLMDYEHVWVVNGRVSYDSDAAGMDELSLCGPTQVYEVRGGNVREFTFSPAMLGLKTAGIEALAGGSPSENAARMRRLFDEPENSPLEDAVLMNAGATLFVAGLAEDPSAGFELAKSAIRSGAASAKLKAISKNK